MQYNNFISCQWACPEVQNNRFTITPNNNSRVTIKSEQLQVACSLSLMSSQLLVLWLWA